MKIIISISIFIFLLMQPIFAHCDKINGRYFYYIIKKDNTLPFILQTYKVTKEELTKANSSATLKKFSVNSMIKIPLKEKNVNAYTIKKGDNLTAISLHFHIPLSVLQRTLPQKTIKNMWAGTIIYLPYSTVNIGTQNFSTPNTASSQKKQITPIKTLNKPAQNTNKNKGQYLIYTIQKGDTFFSLARQFNIPVKDINQYYHHKTLMIDTKIQIPIAEIQKYAKPLPTPNPKQISAIKNPSLPAPENKQVKSFNPEPTNIQNVNVASPIKGRQGEPYSQLIPGRVFIINQENIIRAPITGKIIAIKPFFGFGTAVFIQNEGTVTILASKGLDIYYTKRTALVNQGDKVARVISSYPLYFFVIKDGKVINP